MCPKMSEKPELVRLFVTLSVKLDIIKRIRYDLVGYVFESVKTHNIFH